MAGLEGLNWEELFVGSVAIALGLLALAAGVLSWQAAFELRTIQRLERRCGRNVTRAILALAGLALIALGVAIALGFGPNKAKSAAAGVRPAVSYRCTPTGAAGRFMAW